MAMMSQLTRRIASTSLECDRDRLAATFPEAKSPPVEAALVDPIGEAVTWDRLVSSHPRSTAFHCSAWAKVLVKTYGHRPFYLRVAQGEETVALLPLLEVASPITGRRGVSLPFSDFAGPLVFSDAATRSVLDRLDELARERRWRHLELRAGDSLGEPSSRSAAFCSHVLKLDGGAEEIFSRFDSSVRRAVRKSEQSGLTFHLAHTLEAVEQFRRLHTQTRKRHNLPPQAAKFFHHIYEEIIEPGLGFVASARSGSGTVAAAIFFVWGNKAIFKFGASDETAQNLRGNNLVMWQAIRFLIGEGVQVLDFGRTAADNAGLRRFKMGWGTNQRPIDYRRFITKSHTWQPVSTRDPGFSRHLFRHMPSALNELAGRVIYPHLD